MTLTLKSTGVASRASSVIAVDDDGATIRDFVSSTRTSNMSIHGDVTIGSATWKGASKYFMDLPMSGNDGHGLTFASGHEIPIPNQIGGVGTTVMIVCRGMGSAAVRGDLMATTPDAALIYRNGSGKLSEYPTSVATTTMPSDGTTKFSAAMTYVYGGTWTAYYGLESGSLAADGTGTDPGYGNANPVKYIPAGAGQGGTPYKAHYIIVVPGGASLAELQAIHDDPEGTLFDAGGITGTAASTQALNTSSASGSVGSAGITGTSARTQALNVSAASGSVSWAEFLTDVLVNNTETGVRASESVQYNWLPGWRIGDAIPASNYRGTGTTETDGTFVVPSIPAGAGCALVTVRGATSADDATYLQFGTAVV